MPNVRLSQSRIEALRPRRSPYDVRDAELKGFGVRVLPSGSKRFFVHSHHEGRRIWKTVGDVAGIGQEEARRQAAELLAPILGSGDGTSPISTGRTCSAGSPPFARRPSRPTGPRRSSPSSCAKPNSTATARKAAIPALAFAATGARDGSGSCPCRNSITLHECSTTMRRAIRAKRRSCACCC